MVSHHALSSSCSTSATVKQQYNPPTRCEDNNYHSDSDITMANNAPITPSRTRSVPDNAHPRDAISRQTPSQSQSSQSQSSQSQVTEQPSESGHNPSAIVLSPSDDRGHSTVTNRLLNGNIASDKTRGRSLTGPLGRSLVQFKTTKNVVIAIRDAIIGHFIANSCGVLHRDISIGNVLLAKRGDRLEGVLHDFDFASFISTGPENFTDDEKRLKDLKRMTGTHQFMAIDVLRKSPHKPHHDLESFYWVLVWILLRYANHDNDQGGAACTKLFDYMDNLVARGMKHLWLTQNDEPLRIRGNSPLTALMENLRHIFQKVHRNENVFPTHEAVVTALQTYIISPGWPDLDPPLEFNHSIREDIINTYTSSALERSTKEGSRHSSQIASRNTRGGEQAPEFVALEDVAVLPEYECQRSFSDPLFSDDLLPMDYYVGPSPQRPAAINRDRMLSTERSKSVAGTSSQSLKRQLLDGDTSQNKRRTTGSSRSEGCLED